MSVCFLPYMHQAVAMWQPQTPDQSSPSSTRHLPSCRASSSAFTFSPTPSRGPAVEPSNPILLQNSSPALSSATQQQMQGYGPGSPASVTSATTPLSWKDYPLTSPPPSLTNTPSVTSGLAAGRSPTRPQASSVQYTREKMHVYSGDLSPLEQCRLRTWPLRQWIYQHRKNPYPTKADKRMLAKMANLREDQVNMWFANTRRRIKKVGMRTWSGGLFDDFQTKMSSDVVEATLTHAYAPTSDGSGSGCSSDEESFLSAASTGSDIAFPF